MSTRRLRPWAGNVGKRLVRTPKVYIRDSGLTHAPLDIETWDDVLGHPVAGPSWEGFVIENLIAAAGGRRTPYYYRTETGAEVGLLFVRGDTPEIAIEIKRSSAPMRTRCMTPCPTARDEPRMHRVAEQMARACAAGVQRVRNGLHQLATPCHQLHDASHVPSQGNQSVV